MNGLVSYLITELNGTEINDNDYKRIRLTKLEYIRLKIYLKELRNKINGIPN